jgi:hypothetical protein
MRNSINSNGRVSISRETRDTKSSSQFCKVVLKALAINNILQSSQAQMAKQPPLFTQSFKNLLENSSLGSRSIIDQNQLSKDQTFP